MRDRRASLNFSSIKTLASLPRGLRPQLAPLLPVLKYAAFACFVVALARPQWGTQFEKVTTDGVDMVIALDSSGSMAAEDFKPRNRLAVAKKVTSDFIRRRSHDRMGLVAFAARSVTRCPLTLDHPMLLDAVDRVELYDLGDGTAIGMGLATALERLKNSEAKSRVIILVTDGRNNRGRIDPLTAASIAQALDVKIYTIGVGSEGKVPMPYMTPLGKRYRYGHADIDEDTLTAVAEATNGQYFRATDRESLEGIFDLIDRLEKTAIESRTYTSFRERCGPWLEGGMLCLALWLFMSVAVFRKFP